MSNNTRAVMERKTEQGERLKVKDRHDTALSWQKQQRRDYHGNICISMKGAWNMSLFCSSSATKPNTLTLTLTIHQQQTSLRISCLERPSGDGGYLQPRNCGSILAHKYSAVWVRAGGECKVRTEDKSCRQRRQWCWVNLCIMHNH